MAITITAHNIDQLPALLGWLLEHDLRFSMNFYRDGHQQGVPQLQADEQAIIQGMRRAYGVIAAHPPSWSMLSTILDRTELSLARQRGCAAGHNYLVIDHRGTIASCQMQLAQPVATVHTLNPLGLIRAGNGGVQSVPVDQKQGCQSCAWRYWCGGGCAVVTHLVSGRYDVPSPNCAIYKALYPDVLRLEGVRLLHYAQEPA
jgi:uncharacterized protein